MLFGSRIAIYSWPRKPRILDFSSYFLISIMSSAHGLAAAFENADSLHPILSVDVTGQSSAAVQQSKSCGSYVLIHLPEGLYYDPLTAPKQTAYQSWLLTERIELEKAVGWSLLYPERSSSVFSSQSTFGDTHRQWWEQKPDEDSDSPLAQLDAQLQMEVNVKLEQALREAATRFADSVNEEDDVVERRSVLHSVLEPGSGTNRAERTTLLLELNTTTTTPPSINVPLHTRYQPPIRSAKDDTPGLVPSTLQLIAELIPSSLLRLASLLPIPLPPYLTAPPTHTTTTTTTTVALNQNPIPFTTCQTPASQPVDMNTLFPLSHHHLASHLPAFLPPHTAVWTPTLSPGNDGTQSVPTLNVPTANADLRESVQFITTAAILLALIVVLRSLSVNIARLKQFERT